SSNILPAPQSPGEIQEMTESPAAFSKAVLSQWYVIYVKARHEKRAYAHLLERGVEAYLPLRQEIRKWSDRKKRIEVPLFSCYVFVKAVPQKFEEVYATAGFVRFVSIKGKPCIVPEEQIESVRKMVEYYPEDVEVAEGDYTGRDAEIVAGPLAGIRGKVIDLVGGKFFVIMIEGLNKMLRVKVHAASVKVLER
ncbi:MAG: UpxY family transcription antiterminator, partial [Bacteroidota bacterium]|nr:UpxY family transcription antiterminator [Bacteroidota bacterium]